MISSPNGITKQAKIILLAVSFFFISGSIQAAENFPSRPVTLVVPFPPGGPTDALARVVAQAASKSLGETIIIDNKAGAGGNLGSRHVANAKADGYTLLFGTTGPLTVNVSLYQDLGYHPQRSFDPVIHVGDLPNILVVDPNLPIKTLKDLVDYSNENPSKLTYGSAGVGTSSHLGGALFNDMAGTEILHIPFKGTGPAVNALLGGHVSMLFTDILTVLPHVEAGKLRAIGLVSAERSSKVPDLETLHEQGVEGYGVTLIFGIVAPLGTPPAVVGKLNKAFAEALATPMVKEFMYTQGVEPPKNTDPSGLKDLIDSEIPKWADLIQRRQIASQ